MKKHLFSLTILASTVGFAQVLIDDTGTQTEPNDAAVLELSSDTRGFILPRMDAEPANPVDGMVYYDSDEYCFKGYANGAWYALGGECIEPVVSPVASNLTIVESAANSNQDGTIQDGETIEAQYDYSDPQGNNPEGSSTIEWFIAEDDAGTNEFSMGTSDTFDTTGSQNLYVRYCLTPADDLGNTGDTVCSDYALITPAPSDFPGIVNEFHYNNDSTDVGEFV